METEKIKRLLGLARRQGKLRFGAESCAAAIKRGDGFLLLLAKDAGDATARRFRFLAETAGLPMLFCFDAATLGRLSGRASGAMLLLEEKNLAEEILRLSKTADST